MQLSARPMAGIEAATNAATVDVRDEADPEPQERASTSKGGEGNVHWNEEVLARIREYLATNVDPPDVVHEQLNNFRKRARDFTIQGGRLYYKNKKDASLRLAIGSREEMVQVFMVRRSFSLPTKN